MPPAAALFDNDGLTLDTESAWTRAEAALFARYGQTFTMDHKRELLGTAPAASAAKLESMLGQPGPGLSDELYDLAIEEVARTAAPMPGAVAGEQGGLRARPRGLGVEGQPVVVEQDRGRMHARYGRAQ